MDLNKYDFETKLTELITEEITVEEGHEGERKKHAADGLSELSARGLRLPVPHHRDPLRRHHHGQQMQDELDWLPRTLLQRKLVQGQLEQGPVLGGQRPLRPRLDSRPEPGILRRKGRPLPHRPAQVLHAPAVAPHFCLCNAVLRRNLWCMRRNLLLQQQRRQRLQLLPLRPLAARAGQDLDALRLHEPDHLRQAGIRLLHLLHGHVPHKRRENRRAASAEG